MFFCIEYFKYRNVWRPVLVKINIIKWHHKWLFWPVQHLLWTRCVFLSSLHRIFFSLLLIFLAAWIIFIKAVYFFFVVWINFSYVPQVIFLVVLRIIFNTSIEDYFFIVLIIIFHGIVNLFLGLQCFAGLAVEVDWFESLTSLGDHFENIEVDECFQRECQGETFSGKETKEVFILLTKSVRSQLSVR